MNSIANLYGSECGRMFEYWSKVRFNTPNLLIIQPKNGGVGCDYFVKSLAKAYHLKSGKKRTFKRSFLSLKYSKSFNDHEIRTFFDNPRLCAENYNNFSGTFCINVSDFVEAVELPAFIKLLDFIDSNKKNTKFIFVVNTDDRESVSLLYSTLRVCIRIDRLIMEYTDINTYFKFAVTLFNRHELTVDCGANETLMEYLELLMKKESFAGYDSITRIVEDIVFEVNVENLPELTGAGLEKMKDKLFSEESGKSPYRKIGF